MKTVRLRAITHKGRNKIHEAGNPETWIVRTVRHDLFHTQGEWLLLEPVGMADKSRWVHADNDDDFIVLDSH